MNIRGILPGKLTLYILAPVIIIGFLVMVLLIRLYRPTVEEYFQRDNTAKLLLVSQLGLEICEENFRELLSLRLAEDPSMIETMRSDARARLEALSGNFAMIDCFVVESASPETENFEGLEKGNTGPLTTTFDGNTWVYHSRYFPFWRWYIISIIPLDAAYSPMVMMERIIIITSVTSVVALIMAFIAVSSLLVIRPLNSISTAAKRISRGRLTRVSTKRSDEIGRVIKAFNSMVDSLEIERNKISASMDKLSESEKRFRLIVDNSAAGYYFIDDKGYYQAVNAAWLRLHGYDDISDVAGKSYLEFCLPEESEKVSEVITHVLQGGSVSKGEHARKNKDGSIGYHTYSASPVYSEGRVIGLEGFIIDITERLKAERALRASLTEKEILLKEIHHRVKNNLNIVTSLLTLQRGSIQSVKQARSAIGISIDRVHSMALVHEKIYESENLSRINMKSYIESMIFDLISAYAMDLSIDSNLSIAPVTIDISRAVPCGLILNELLTNSLIHAFIGRTSGTISISLTTLEKGKVMLTVGDDGIGLPENIHVESATSLGLQLVTLLTEQLDGSLTVDTSRGTSMSIVFPIS